MGYSIGGLSRESVGTRGLARERGCGAAGCERRVGERERGAGLG
jgi:hypothetical protein